MFFSLLLAVYSYRKENTFHRDIKPENIIIQEKGEKYVFSDFGISK
jgi:serine/threonine protein kinase